MRTALSQVENVLNHAGLWRSNAVLLAAVSGGPDSVALLYCLTQARQTAGFTVCACHVQHGLRGENSLLDEALVRDLCGRWNVPLEVMQAGLNATMADPGIETLARERRQALFQRCMEDFHADALLTAHHLDDQAETVLMRLLRGAGGGGLCGISPRRAFGRGVALRPFLALRKDELLALLHSASIPYRHDESNDLCGTPRNILRLSLLPQMKALFPEASRHIAQAAKVLRAEDECLAALTDELYQGAVYQEAPILALRREALLSAPTALRFRALRRFYREGLALCGLSPDERELSYDLSDGLAALLSGERGETLNLPCGLMALRGGALLHLLRQGGQPLLPSIASTPLWLDPAQRDYTLCGVTLSLTPAERYATQPTDANAVFLPEALLCQCQLRTSAVDDRIWPLGAPGQKPLRRYLTDRKVDRPFRPALPLLAQGDRVLWIPGLVTGEELRWKPDHSLWRLTLCGLAPYLPDDNKE